MSTEPQRLGKYELQERLGRGGMAEVWKAFDPQLQRHVALKVLHADLQNDPEFVTRFEREARIIAGLHHPNIVQLHDFQVSRTAKSHVTTAYMVMDYIEGPTLADHIAHTSGQRQFPPATEIVHLFTAIGLAVDYAHQKGMIHRDLKPANILLDQRNTTRSPIGEPILTDFGMVKLLGASTGLLSSSWVGTPLYVAPEQAQGYPGNERSDIYALGVILYEICTGVLPFQGQSAPDILKQHINMQPPSPALINPHVSPALAMVILRCLAKDPAARFPSASALAAALASAFNLPLPDRLPSQPGFLLDEGNEPTLYRPRKPSASSSPLAPSVLSASGSEAPPLMPSTPATPSVSQRLQTSEQVGVPLTNIVQSAGTPLAPSSAQSATRKRRRGLVITLLVLLILVLLGSALGSAFWLTHQGNTTPVPAASSQVVGSAFFVSSGQLNEGNSQGINDELQINLQNIPEPAAGQSYYAWLLGDLSQPAIPPLLLGMLPVKHGGGVQFLYPGDQQHSNLIATYSRLLVTEQDATTAPLPPSTDHRPWRYYAELPQTPDPADTTHHFSALDHLRHLLNEDPTIESVGVHGGLNIWLFRNTGKILEWAGSARDYWGEVNSITLMRNQFIRILDYLDGASNVRTDVPTGTPMLVGAPVALLGPDTPGVQSQTSTDYLHETSKNLNAIALAPGTTPKVRQLAAQINIVVNKVRKYLENVRQDAKELLSMTNTQLLTQESLSMLDDMVTQAFYAYAGQLDPSTNKVQEGVSQINYDVIRLATFDIEPYKY